MKTAAIRLLVSTGGASPFHALRGLLLAWLKAMPLFAMFFLVFKLGGHVCPRGSRSNSVGTKSVPTLPGWMRISAAVLKGLGWSLRCSDISLNGR